MANPASLKLPAIFGDNMVLQRSVPVSIWGQAAPGQSVTVTIDGRSATAPADTAGHWSLKIGPLQAGGPYELSVQAGQQSVVYRDVLVGEVWLCSGQSNMELTVPETMNAQQELAQTDYPQIRLIRVPKTTAWQEQDDVQAAWKVCNRDNAITFSAVGYFFGREIHKRLGVPVGLIDASWGGTIVEAWTSMPTLKTQPEIAAIMREVQEALKDLPKAEAEYHAKLLQWEKDSYWEDPGNQGEAMGYARPDLDDSGWETMDLPTTWEATGMDIDGAVWFRREVQLKAEWLQRPLTLGIGIADDYDTTYFNGVKVGGFGKETPNSWSIQRQYKLDPKILKPGRNVIAVRVFDRWGTGGLTGPSATMAIADAKDALATLSGPWKYKVELALEPKPFKPAPILPPNSGNPNIPGVLFNGMIAPLIPLAVAGTIWYQGESNANQAYRYRHYFPMMINDWRQRWGCEMPFHFVELANYMGPQVRPVELQTWPEVRESQQLTLSLPRTGMATAIDIGDAGDIHPRNKQEVGRRLALSAMAVNYGQELVYSGPLYESSQVEGGSIRIRFRHVGGGLQVGACSCCCCGTGGLRGFAIAGEDRKWVWAQAKIDGNTVVCSSPQVAKPAAVRYSWADNPIGNLYNADGLPASPFRTDTWPGLTDDK